MKWKLVNEFVSHAINNDSLLIDAKVFQQHGHVTLFHSSLELDGFAALSRQVDFVEIVSAVDVEGLAKHVCRTMRLEFDSALERRAKQ